MQVSRYINERRQWDVLNFQMLCFKQVAKLELE